MKNKLKSLNKNFNYFITYLQNKKIKKSLISFNESFILERLHTSLDKIKNHLNMMELCSDGRVRVITIPEKNVLSIKKQKVVKVESYS
jgi:hypothetical protein